MPNDTVALKVGDIVRVKAISPTLVGWVGEVESIDDDRFPYPYFVRFACGQGVRHCRFGAGLLERMPMSDNEIPQGPLNFLCPNCGSGETVSRRLTEPERENGSIPPDVFSSLSRGVTPISAPKVLGVQVDIIVTYQDVCAQCGTPYCTRAERAKAMVNMQGPAAGRGPFGLPPLNMGQG